MMEFLAGSLALNAPAFLLALPAALATLLYAYRRGGRGREVPVSSVFILRKFARPASAPRKFHIPWRLLFELVLCAALSAAAAGLFMRQSGPRVALVIDNSLRFAVRRADGSTFATSAIEEAQAALNHLPSRATVKAFATAPQLRALSQDYGSRSDGVALLKQLSFAYSEPALEQGILQVARGQDIDQVVGIGDRDAPLLAASTGTEPQVQLFDVRRSGEKLSNVAITNVALGIISTAAAADNLQISVLFSSNDLPTTWRGRLEVYGWTLDSKEGRELVTKEQAFERPGEVSVRLKVATEGYAALQIKITSQGSDVIAEDNEAWIVIGGASEGRSWLVGALTAPELGIDRIPGYGFISKSLKQYEERSDISDFWASSNAPSLVLFHGAVPSRLPQKNSLFINPPKDNALFRGEALVRTSALDGQVTRWLDAHPITTYLNLSALELTEASVFSIPAWARPLVWVPSGPVAFAGEKNQVRLAVVGFELLPFEGKKNPLISVFLLNLLKWASSSTLGEESIRPHTRVELRTGEIGARMLGGDDLAILKDASGVSFVEPTRPGVVVLTRQGGASRLVPVNFMSADASNLDSRGSGAIIVPTRSHKADSDAHFDLARVLALGVALLLALDLLICFIRLWRKPEHAYFSR